MAVRGAACTIGREIGAGGATVERVDAPPDDPEEWSDEQWQAYLQATADTEADLDAAGPAEGATGFRKLKSSAAGAIAAAGMLGIEQALFGERPKEEVVAEAESDDPDRDRSHFDRDDPASATISLVADPPPSAADRLRRTPHAVLATSPARGSRHRARSAGRFGGRASLRCPWGGCTKRPSFSEKNQPPPALVPPSTGMLWPVTNDDRSDARNSATRAWSSGQPRRPTGAHDAHSVGRGPRSR